ncbi:MAG: GNAT family N-acetyltransferase [Burkholderiales bacterium]|nr:GNAT family N-acetyltransferase [Burkholderiales bacterium]
MSVTLIPISIGDLRALVESRIPDGIASRALEEALPPAFVARRSLEQIAAGKPVHWCTSFYMLRIADGNIAGSCGFKDAPANGRVEIGYGVSTVCRNQGVATAAITALLKIAFASGIVNEVLAQVNPDNIASTRVVEKLGFKSDGLKTDESNEVLVQWLVTQGKFAQLQEAR